jgi:Flp pilus assembly protein TadD
MKNFLSKILWLLALSFGLQVQLARADGESQLLAAEGKVEISHGGAAWAAAQTNSVLHTGDRIRTGLRSRAVVRLANLSVVRVNELTTFVVQPPSAPGKTSKLSIESGSTYFFSRERPADVEFSTPLSSGAIRGTEFNLSVSPTDSRTVVTLVDGALSISNSLGALDIASGEEATVEPGQPPKKTSVINTVNIIQWCLYYPGVLDLAELDFSDAEKSALEKSLADYRAGDLLGAVADYPSGRAPSSDTEKIYFAQLLLAAGQVAPAEVQLDQLAAASPLAGALREVIAAVKSQNWNRNANASLAGEFLADSYLFQSRAKLDDALKTARKSVERSPNFGFGWARVAELEFSFGRTKAASTALDKALGLSPRNAEAVSLEGFLLAAENKFPAARKKFDEAIALDGALGNAWLGRGLVRIHAGDANGGRQDLQVAATVEPQRAILRSYLGKAFANAHDNKRAQKDFSLAQKLDANDPTVWLYSALLDEQENRVNDAVRDLEKSQSLNDNRKIYRSQMLLDQDRAVRGANLANIYRDAGMTDVSVREAMQAVNADYANYSSHLFLANSFYGLLDPNRVNLRYETPYLSEYLVANLLAPVGAGTLSQQVSQQEYSRLFERDGVGASLDTLYLDHGDWHQSLAEYGNFGNSAFAFEQNYSKVHGYRPNSDEEDHNFDFRFKQQLTPKDTAYIQVSVADANGGNRVPYYNQAEAQLAPIRFKDEQKPIVVAGLHHEWSPGVDTLLLVSRLDDTYSVTNPLQQNILNIKDAPGGNIVGIIPFVAQQNYRSKLEIYSVEAQQIWQTHRFTTIAGARVQTGGFTTLNQQETSDINIFGLTPDNPSANQNLKVDFERENFYAYEHWQPNDALRFIGGVSYDRLVTPENFRYAPISANTVTSYHLLPKAGMIWTPLPDTTVRGGYAQSVGGASFDQSFQLEPTQVAGFNQAFRSLIPDAFGGASAGATFTMYGVSLEQKFPTRTYLALAGDLLKSHVERQVGTYDDIIDPVLGLAGPFTSSMGERMEYTEWDITGSAHQLIGRDWSLGAVYRWSRANLFDNLYDITPANAAANGFTALNDYYGTLHSLDLQLIYQNPSGFFAQADGLWWHQENHNFNPARPGDDFWQCNMQAGWRFFHRRAELTVGVLNVTGDNYRLNPLNLYSEPPRDRTIFTRLKVQF